MAPVYKPRAADVWSLGIVLINMYVSCSPCTFVFLVLGIFAHAIFRRLYHFNPWVDTVKDGCSSFDQYLSNPTNFFMRRCPGMTFQVANFLVENVFCILEEPTDDSQRISAREFGLWVRDLPTLMAASQPATHTHSRVPSAASIATGHPIASAPPSRRPSSRQASVAGGSPRRPPVPLRSLSRNTSMDPVFDRDGSDGAVLPAHDLVFNEEDEEEEQRHQQSQRAEHEAGVGRSPSPSLRSNSNTKRRKRGRKGKGTTPSMDPIQTSEVLASASQTLARQLSRQPRSASATMQSFDVPPPPPVPVLVSMPVVTKKPSKWKLPFGKSASEAAMSTRSDSHSSQSNSGSALATNVSNVIMALDPSSVQIPTQLQSPPFPVSPSAVVETTARGRGELQSQSRRAASPTSGRPVSGISSSAASNNWRNSMASTNTSTSTFTRYSNQSLRSVSTFATSVSASSASSSTNWRKQSDSTSLYSNDGSQSSHNSGLPRRPPSNIKRTYFSAPPTLIPGINLLMGRSAVMNGVPWELSGAPRQLHQKDMDIFGVPPLPRERKRAGRGGGKGKQPATGTAGKSALEPITERPQQTQYRQDAATSTTDLASQTQGQQGAGQGQGLQQGQGGGRDNGGAPKMGRAQISALAKMLSALGR